MYWMKRIYYWIWFMIIAITLPVWWAVGYNTTLEMTHKDANINRW